MTWLVKLLERVGLYLGKGPTLWRMPTLSYPDAVNLRQIVQSKYDPEDQRDAHILGLFVFLMEGKILERCVATLVKPVWGLGWWNHRRMAARGVAEEMKIVLFDMDQQAVIINRFFSKGASWMSGLLVFAGRSITSQETIPIIPNFVSLRNPLYPSPTEISKPQEGF